jgi:hypothetical protein
VAVGVVIKKILARFVMAKCVCACIATNAR